MPLIPARTKYRKQQKGRVKGIAHRGNTLSFGDFGIQALARGSMTSNQIEAARVAVTRHLKRKGKVWIRVFPHKPITKKPAEVRMGSGKGAPETRAKFHPPVAIPFNCNPSARQRRQSHTEHKHR